MAVSKLPTNSVDKKARTSVPTGATRTTARKPNVMTSQEAMNHAIDVLRDSQDYKMGRAMTVEAVEFLEEALAKQEGQSNFCPQCEALARELKAAKQEQGEPVAIIHRNEYNEYRLEPHDNFDIKSIPFNVDVTLFKGVA